MLEDEDQCQKCSSNTNVDEQYSWIYTLRKSTILFSVTALCIVISLIIKKQQYRHQQMRLFLLVLIFYEISLSSVLPHNKAFNHDNAMLPQDQDCTLKVLMNCIIQSGESYMSAIQGFVNLSAYAMTNWFAVCIMLYIKAKSQQINFKIMNRQTWIAVFGIIIWYLVPFILAFIKDMPFSFGPIGYSFSGDQQYFFYSGINALSKEAFFVVALWYLLIPVILCGYAIMLRIKTADYIRQIKEKDEFNQTKITLVLCIVQIMNPLKQILNFFQESLSKPLFVINSIFDFLPLSLVYLYFKYYESQGSVFQDSTNRKKSQIQSSAQNNQSLL